MTDRPKARRIRRKKDVSPAAPKPHGLPSTLSRIRLSLSFRIAAHFSFQLVRTFLPALLILTLAFAGGTLYLAERDISRLQCAPLSADGTIDAGWMSRVKEVVDYAYNDGLYVILNVHHDDALWLVPTKDKLESDKATLTAIWKQICATFQDYDHRLIFEGMNEPRVIGSAEEWTGGTQESYDVINELFQAFVDTVRASGGSNTDRTVIVTDYAQSAEKKAIEGMIVPKDDHVIVSLHIYAPWKFCGPDDTRADWGSDADKKELDETFQYLDDTFISKGIPVIIDETGCVNKNENTSARAAWFSYYLSAAKKHGIKCFIWDNNETKNGFGLLNRKDCTWYYPEIIQAIQDAVK